MKDYQKKYEKLKDSVDLAMENINFLIKTYKDIFDKNTAINIKEVVKSYEYIADILNGKEYDELVKKYELDKEL